MVPPKVSRSTMAAHNRGSVNVLVQPPKDSLDAIATEGRRRLAVRRAAEQAAREIAERLESP